MVQSVNFKQPVYNAVSINIKNPEVNTGQNKHTNPIRYNNDSGIYNAVKIDIDEPKVNTKPKKIYDYPQAESIVTYGMLNFNPIEIHNIGENEFELPNSKPQDTAEEVVFEEIPVVEEEAVEENSAKVDTDAGITDDEVPAGDNNEFDLPAPNYTTPEAEKSEVTEEVPVAETDEVKTTALSFKAKAKDDNENEAGINSETKELSFRGDVNEVKKPEIIPSEEIRPKVDIPLVLENLTSSDKDIQALQIEEITRLALDEPKFAKNYLVSDVFSELINISKEDAIKLAPPTKEQIIAREKLITNIMAVEKDEKAINNLPYNMSEDEVNLALDLSPLEIVERNKEYAITALGALAELFIEDYQEKEGKIVPITDAPGVSAIVNALSKDPDSSVKITAITALMHIRRPEYKEELSALFTMAQTDPDPQVSGLATEALNKINKI